MDNTQKILGINTSFSSIKYEGFVNDDIRSSISFMDYDAVIIDTSYLAENYGVDYQKTYQGKRLISKDESHRIVEEFTTIKTQIIEFLKQGKNIFILMAKNDNCFVHTGQTKYSGTGKNARETNVVREFDVFSFLPIEIKPIMVSGDKFNIVCQPPYSTFFQKIKNNVYYDAYFKASKQNSLLALPNSDKAISAYYEYENGKIIVLPYPHDEGFFETQKKWKKFGKEFLNALFELNLALSSSANSYILPQWSNNIKILDEEIEENNLKKEIEKLRNIEKKIEKRNDIIRRIKNKKILLTASGTPLEEMVKETLNEIGFAIRETEKGRSDIVASYKKEDIVAEIKGVSKSAAEKHAAQLEKWVSEFVLAKEKEPKAILIVNGYCDTPLMQRKEDVFPAQMLKFCESRGHALITTTQLLCLYIEIKDNPGCATERIAELLSCVGKYKRYQDFEKYFKIIASEE